MFKLKLWKLFAILFEIFLEISASTHWVVTENGRIQAQLDSPYHMSRPYDLLALLEQERRVHDSEELYEELVSRKAAIDKQWGSLKGPTDLETLLYAEDADCVQAGHRLVDTDLYASFAGGIENRIELDGYLMGSSGGEPSLPDCIEAVDLDFTMHGFEHLQAMLWRANLTSTPEVSLVSSVLEEQDIALFAHQVASGLQHNSTSWLHHNLAAIYWRIRGDATNAIECARRAVHFAPRQYRDLALLTLGGVLHQARASSEAAIIMHAAVDHAPLEPLNHLALGTVYAILGDFNRSVACLDNALKLQPGLKPAVRMKHLVVCHQKLKQGLLELHESLLDIVDELREYHVRQEQWFKLQEKLLWQQAPLEMRLLGQDHQSLAAVLHATAQSCVQGMQEGRTMLSCDLNSDSQVLAHSLQMDIALSLQMLLKNVESQAKKISEQMSHQNHFSQDQPLPNMSAAHADPQSSDQYQSSSYIPAKLSKDKEAVYEHEGWPSKEECTAFAEKFPKVEDFPSAFLPPENKGFEVSLYLGQLIGLTPGEEHSLPWYPPVCNPEAISHEPLVQQYFPLLVNRDDPVPDESLRSQLLKYGEDGQLVEAEIGQRILTAINKEVGPSWLLHTVAALYWRVRGNSKHALDCLQVALSDAPSDFRDVVLVSLGALLQRLGHVEIALRAAQEAVSGSSLEPIAHFLLASIFESRGNYSGAVLHLRRALAMEPDFLDGKAQDLLRAAACRDRFGNQGTTGSLDTNNEEMCGASSDKHMDLLSSLEGLKDGETVLCSANGEQCRAVQCFSANQDSGGVVTLEPAAVSKLLASGSGHCGGALLGSEHTDETELERMTDPVALPKQFHLRIALGEDGSLQSAPLGEFYVPVALTDDTWLHVYDKSGTYLLSPGECERIHTMDWGQQTAVWLSSANGGIVLEMQLPPLPPDGQEVKQPECDPTLPPSPLTLDHLAGVRLRHRLQCGAETGLSSWLSAVAGEDGSSTQELGARLALALQENATSWVLATAAALYWRVMGQATQAVTCLRQALQYAPSPDKNIPLVSLASVLHRAGFYSDALVVANMALELAPKFELTHFTLGNIHASMGDLEKAISFYRSSLALQPEFEPARNRLQSVLCSLLFEEQTVKP